MVSVKKKEDAVRISFSSDPEHESTIGICFVVIQQPNKWPSLVVKKKYIYIFNGSAYWIENVLKINLWANLQP